MNFVRRSTSRGERCSIIVPKEDLLVLYSDAPLARKERVWSRLGPLRRVFAHFVANEQGLKPLAADDLVALFGACSDPRMRADELLTILRTLAPGNRRIGFHQVNFLVDLLRSQVSTFLRTANYDLSLPPHDHAFGSGGDFWKAGHATANASIVVAPVVPICKTGTTQITAEHGSYRAIQEIGYCEPVLNPQRLNQQLVAHGFAFVPLSALGFPYSDALRTARRHLWNEALESIEAAFRSGRRSWQEAITATNIPLDIFKVVSPNAQVLNPVHHSTGVYHLSMLPYVLGIYLHLGTSGLIAHCYDGIDELSNATSDPTKNRPNNLVIKVEADQVVIVELSPEDLGFARADLREIEEQKVLRHDAATFWRVLCGVERGPKRDFVVANAALLLVAGGAVGSPTDLVSQLRAGVSVAEQLISSGRAYSNFRRLLAS